MEFFPRPTLHPPTRIRSASRAVRLLLFVADGVDGHSAKACGEALGLPLSTAHHLLSTLVDERLLSKDTKRRYHLGPKIGVLADAFQRQMLPRDYLLAPLRHLAEITAETAHLCAWRHGQVVVLASIEGVQAVRVASLHTGMDGDAHARASGKLLLALADPSTREAYLTLHPPKRRTERTVVDRAQLDVEFEQIRELGYALDDEEFAPGVACVAAPIRAGAAVIGAYSVSAPLARFNERKRWLIEAVRGAALAGGDATPREEESVVAG